MANLELYKIFITVDILMTNLLNIMIGGNSFAIKWNYA